MNRWYPYSQLFRARLREFYREPVALFWVYGFPLILALVLGIAFANKKPDPPQVDVQESADNATLANELADHLRAADIKVTTSDEADCTHRLNTGKTMLVIVPSRKDGKEHFQYVYDTARSESVSARYQVDAAIVRWQSPAKTDVHDEYRSEPGTRYIDFLLPGLIGLNLMGGGLWGVGFVIVDMRVRRLLKRLLATPMRRSDFLLAMLSARTTLMLPDMLVLILVGLFGFGVPLRGSVFALAVTVFAGAAAFAGIGLLVACRTDKTETVSGLMNLVMLPMWLLSGAFFSSKHFPDAAQPFIQALPLTQLNDALREIMLEGVSLSGVAWRLGILAAWAVVSFALALKWFRWL